MSTDPPPIVCFAGQDWVIHGRAHCDFQVMRELGKHRRVLVVNGIGMRMPMPGRTDRPLYRVARKLRSILGHFLRRPLATSPGLWVMTPLSVPVFGRPVARRLNANLVAAQVWMVSRALGIRDPWALTTLPTWIDVVECLGWQDRVVYYRADDHAAQPDVDRALIVEFEDRLIAAAKLVLYSSRALMENEADRAGDRRRFVDHGVETDHFTPVSVAAEPADLAAIAHPRVGFYGQIEPWTLDLDLIARIADEIPEAQVVLIGRSATDLTPLAARPNVHVLGFRSYEELPSYGRGFDVALIAKPMSDWVRAMNPIKLKEYLAQGLRVVALGTPDMVRFADVVSLHDDADGFVGAVREAIATPVSEEERARRRAHVLADGWDVRAQRIVELIAGLSTTG